MALTDKEFAKCAGCDSDFPAEDPGDKFCGECSDHLCVVCNSWPVVDLAKDKACDDCGDKGACRTCGEHVGVGIMCGDCIGGSEEDPAVGEAWSGGFTDNH